MPKAMRRAMAMKRRGMRGLKVGRRFRAIFTSCG
jgi:hypothetical protein